MKTLCVVIALFMVIIPNLDPALATSKIIQKTVKKVVTPEIAPVEPPESEVEQEANPVLPPPPPPPAPVTGIQTLEKDPGIFGWGLASELGGSYQFMSGQQGFLGAFSANGNLVFEDPLLLGAKLGLAEDAFEYKVGLGLILGQDVNNQWLFSIPLGIESTVYFNQGSLAGLTPFVGAGLNMNLIGTDFQMGGLGPKIYAGILADLGFSTGKTRLAVGYSNFKVGSIRTIEGIYFSVSQPIVL